MAAFFSGSFSTSSLSVNAFDFDVIVDTHDGSDSRRKRVEDVPGFDEKHHEREDKARLRDMLARAVDPEAFRVPEEALAAAEPVFERLESGAVRIDWKRIERENVLRAQLYAYAAEYERARLEFEQDEEDVSLLLWH